VIFLLDTNPISDLMTNHTQVTQHAAKCFAAGDVLGLCRPVHYEIMRGLLWRGASGKLSVYVNRVVPILTWIELDPTDWEQAAQFWAEARRNGKQLGDPDLLLAALARQQRYGF
jgi:predicted nucleic acid-binding protein